MTNMKNKIFEVVADVAGRYGHPADSRHEVCRQAALLLDKEGINCASDGSRAGDYLVEALDKYC